VYKKRLQQQNVTKALKETTFAILLEEAQLRKPKRRVILVNHFLYLSNKKSKTPIHRR